LSPAELQGATGVQLSRQIALLPHDSPQAPQFCASLGVTQSVPQQTSSTPQDWSFREAVQEDQTQMPSVLQEVPAGHGGLPGPHPATPASLTQPTSKTQLSPTGH
jgi:hypothetical protein